MLGESRSPRALDLLAIGCGPFNLGLAALASEVQDLSLLALEAADELRWHPGLMFEDATLQVSFLADLVTLVDPTHPLSFLAYLRDIDRMYPFYVRERFHLLRREYEDYLRWAAGRLTTLRFGHRVDLVEWNREAQCFAVQVTAHGRETQRFFAKHLVIGIGTEPSTPAAIANLPPERWLHASDYFPRRDDIDRASHVTVVGSGQSGAEIVLDLLRRSGVHTPEIAWLTRTAAFAPLDYTKLVLEMTTPEYMHYFHALPEATRDKLVREQWQHYKGISTETLAEIHELLYRRCVEFGEARVEFRFGVAVESAAVEGGSARLRCRHMDTGTAFEHSTELVVAATGYRHRSPHFLEPIQPYLRRDARGRLRLTIDHAVEADPALTGRIFVAHADLHSHGVAAPDLGIAAYRNARILNVVTGRQVYDLPQRTAFTRFGPPGADSRDTASATSAIPEIVRR